MASKKRFIKCNVELVRFDTAGSTSTLDWYVQGRAFGTDHQWVNCYWGAFDELASFMTKRDRWTAGWEYRLVQIEHKTTRVVGYKREGRAEVKL